MADWTSCMAEIDAGSGTKVSVPTLKCLEIVYQNLLSVIISLAGLALFIMFLIGGFKFLTSAGDPKATTSAKHTMTYGVMGLGLMALAYIIFRLIELYTGTTVTNFFIPDISAP